MAFRGRGRGRGYGGRGGGFGYAKQEAFELFPEISLPDAKLIPIRKDLVIKNYKFENYWRSSPYHLKDADSTNESEDFDIETYADMEKRKTKSRRGSLNDVLLLRPDNLPSELLPSSKSQKRPRKRPRWNPDADLQKLDLFEKLEQKHQAQGEEEAKKKEGEDEEEAEDDAAQEDEGEYSDDGDYNQNEYFDDDEDDYNMGDDNDDEPIY